MKNILLLFVLLLLLSFAIAYLWRAKKRGKACIGCPYGSACSKSCGAAKHACRQISDKKA